MVLEQPTISIITVNYNEGDNLDITLQKSIDQTYPNKEIIVIDGGSNDNSQEVIEKHKKDISFWCSEKDKGIYDAMNKGLQKVTGDWVIFMNAGDWFYNNDVLESIFGKNLDPKIELIYGDHHVRYHEFSRYHKADDSLSSLKWRNVFSHQALFTRTDLAKKYPYELKYSLVADFDFFFKCYVGGNQYQYNPITISSISAGGVSEKKGHIAIDERKEVVKKETWSYSLSFYYKFIRQRNILGEFFKRVLPHSVVKLLTILKYRFFG